MNKNKMSLIKTLHILSATLWLGASASLVLLQCLRGWSEDRQELAFLNLNFSILDFALIIPGAVGSLATGYVICKTSSWGFTRYRWVIWKWIGTLTGISVGTALLGPWQMQMVKLSSQPEIPFTAGATYPLLRSLFTLTGAVQVILLVCMLVISVRKPWGKRLASQKENRVISPTLDRRFS